MKYDRHFLMTETDAIEFAVNHVKFFAPEEQLTCREIGDGNINYVFRIESRTTGKSLVIKQADVLLRSAGRPLDTKHSRLEAAILAHQGNCAPGLVPRVYDYCEPMCAISMEDISAFENTRKGLMKGHIYPTFAEDIVRFMVDTTLPTTDLIMEPKAKKELVMTFTNPEICEITEKLVLAEPFGSPADDNVVTAENQNYVHTHLYENHALRTEAAILRNHFMNNAQALIHGDLHTGSIFGNETGLKIIDPEFAFFGPMGYDCGNVIANLLFSLAYWQFCDSTPDAAGRSTMHSWLTATVTAVFDRYRDVLSQRYDDLVTFDLYCEPSFKQRYIDSIMADTIGYAGTELIRRTVGSSKVAEVEAFALDDPRRAALERLLIDTGSAFIMERGQFTCGAELLQRFCSRTHSSLDSTM